MYNNLYNIFTNNYICASNTASLQRENEKYKNTIIADKKKYKSLKKDYNDLVEKYIELENQYVSLELKYEDFLNNIFTNDDYIFDDTEKLANIEPKESNASNDSNEGGNNASNASIESYTSNVSSESEASNVDTSCENLSDDYETI
jgi:predicted nuclease with TOPRIM domain